MIPGRKSLEALVATMLWVAVHGVTSLQISMPDFPYFRDSEALVDRLLGSLGRGLSS